MHSSRVAVSLDGPWRLVLDPEDTGLTGRWFDREEHPNALDVTVPSVWDRWVPDYDGVGWYFKTFDVDAGLLGRHVELRFEAADYYAEVFLNGVRLGDHEGGYTPFTLVAGAHLKATGNRLAVRLVDPHGASGFGEFGAGEFPCAKEDRYYSFGGLWGSVSLVAMDPAHIEDVFVQPDLRRKRIAVEVRSSAPGTVHLHIEGTPYRAEGAPGSLALEFPEFEMWSPEDPKRYTLVSELHTDAGVVDSVTTCFGMREFTVKDNRFYLNNRPIFLKGISLQPDYPRTLAAPETEELARRELTLVKEAGFNLVRTHVKTPARITLDLADELGLLVYEEPPIGWLKPSDAMRARCEQEVREMILRDRNHPSVVIWGILSKTGNAQYASSGGAQALKAPLSLLARALDPSRLIIDDSGGTNATRESAQLLRPYRDEFEPYDDLQLYQRAPVDQDIERYYRLNGDPNRLCFLSGFGFGGPEDLADVLSHYGAEKDSLKDARNVSAMLAASERGFLERGLDRLFGDFSGFTKAARELQADAARHQVDNARANPKWAGYCYTQLADAGPAFCAGVLDRWRRPKPVLETFKKLHQPLRPLIQMHRTNLIPREQVPVMVLLLNEARLEGVMDVSLQVVGPTNQVLWKKRRAAKLPKSGKELWSGAIGASGSTGLHKFVVRLVQNNRIVAENSVEFFVQKEITPTDVNVHVLDSSGYWAKRVSKWAKPANILAPVHVVPPLANTIRGYPDNELLQVLAQVEQGAVALVLSPPDDWNDLADRIDPALRATSKDAVGGSLPVAHYVKLHPIFDGLPTRCLMRQPYRNVVPNRTFVEGGDEDICGCYDTTPVAAGHYPSDETSWWGNDLLIKRFGSGRIVFTHLRILDVIDFDPVAQRIFVNLIQHLARRSVPSNAPVPPRKEPVEWLRREKLNNTHKWMVLGEFANWGGTGHDMAYPPEKQVDLTATYPGWYKAISWRPWYGLWNDDHKSRGLVDLQKACSPVFEHTPRFDHGTAYAYAEFSAERRQDLRFDFAVTNAMKVWLNGVLIHENNYQVPHDDVRWEKARAWCKQGRNTLLVKCSKNPGPFRFGLDVESAEKEALIIKWWK